MKSSFRIILLPDHYVSPYVNQRKGRERNSKCQRTAFYCRSQNETIVSLGDIFLAFSSLLMLFLSFHKAERMEHVLSHRSVHPVVPFDSIFSIFDVYKRSTIVRGFGVILLLSAAKWAVRRTAHEITRQCTKQGATCELSKNRATR